MTINTMDMKNIIQETVNGFNSRVQQHYEVLTEDDLIRMADVVEEILEPKVSDAAVQNRQYNPNTDEVEEI